MKRPLLIIVLFIACSKLQAQIELVKFVGKNASDYGLGYGAFFKFSYPVSQAADVSLEAGLIFALLNDGGSGDGSAFVPLKLGYRYTLNGTGEGFYVEPQAGFNAYGVTSVNVNGYTVNSNFHGIILGAGVGYLFPPSKWIQFDIGLRYETIIAGDNSLNYLAFRISHNFSFKKRESDY
jgi:hypothetical protein